MTVLKARNAPRTFSVSLICSMAFLSLAPSETRADSITGSTITFVSKDKVPGTAMKIDFQDTSTKTITADEFKRTSGKFLFINTFKDQTVTDLDVRFSVNQKFVITAGFNNTEFFNTTTCGPEPKPRQPCNPMTVLITAGGTAHGLSPQQTEGATFATGVTYTPAVNGDLFTITPSIPEPRSFLLLGTGLAGLALWRKSHSAKRRRRT